jgi:ATP-dependent protease HslVU (ClpYQ) peptidase subunit
MTAVLALIEGGRVYMGGDSATVWDNDTTRMSITSNPKVFRVGPFLVGSAGSGRTQRVLRHGWTPPPRRKLAVEHWISTAVVDSIRKVLMDAGVAEKHDNTESARGDILLAHKGRVWRVDDDYNVDEPRDPIEGVGCGAIAGMAALLALAHRRNAARLPPKERILAALEIAERLSWGVRRPFCVEEL